MVKQSSNATRVTPTVNDIAAAFDSFMGQGIQERDRIKAAADLETIHAEALLTEYYEHVLSQFLEALSFFKEMEARQIGWHIPYGRSAQEILHSGGWDKDGQCAPQYSFMQTEIQYNGSPLGLKNRWFSKGFHIECRLWRSLAIDIGCLPNYTDYLRQLRELLAKGPKAEVILQYQYFTGVQGTFGCKIHTLDRKFPIGALYRCTLTEICKAFFFVLAQAGDGVPDLNAIPIPEVSDSDEVLRITSPQRIKAS